MADRDAAIAQSHLELNRRIRERAYPIWTSHTGHEGGAKGAPDTALEDWLKAEREVLGGANLAAAQNRETVVGDPRGELIPPAD